MAKKSYGKSGKYISALIYLVAILAIFLFLESLVTYLITAVIGGSIIIFYWLKFRKDQQKGKTRLAEAVRLGADKAVAQHPQIDPYTCIGCGACVAACPVEGITIGLARQTGNTVSISYRKEKFFRIKSRNQQRIDEMIQNEKINVYFESNIVEIKDRSVRLAKEGETIEIENDFFLYLQAANRHLPF